MVRSQHPRYDRDKREMERASFSTSKESECRVPTLVGTRSGTVITKTAKIVGLISVHPLGTG